MVQSNPIRIFQQSHSSQGIRRSVGWYPPRYKCSPAEIDETRQITINVKERLTSERTAIGQIYNEELARTSSSRGILASAHSARVVSVHKLFLGIDSTHVHFHT